MELNGEKRSCRLQEGFSLGSTLLVSSGEDRDCCENEAQQPDDKKVEQLFATKSDFRFKASQRAERISGADMNFVE